MAAVLVEEINRAGGDAASVNAQMAICRTLVLHGSEEQKQESSSLVSRPATFGFSLLRRPSPIVART